MPITDIFMKIFTDTRLKTPTNTDTEFIVLVFVLHYKIHEDKFAEKGYKVHDQKANNIFFL